MRPGTRLLLPSLAAALALAAGCAGTAPMDHYALDNEAPPAEEGPLGGEALAQRKQEMSRALGDLRHIHATLDSLIERRDNDGIGTFEDFVSRYMGIHLVPLLRAEWQSAHPELMALDANLRLVEAEVLVLMRYPRKVQEVIDDIEHRFEGRENMLVEYPVGEQSTLGEALELLRERKWRG